MTDMTNSELYEHYKELIEQYEGEIKKLTRPLFEEKWAKLFEENPDLESYTWSQYTPSYNDGDPTFFSAYRGEEIYNGISEDEMYESETIDKETSERWKKVVWELRKQFRGEDYELMFGDPAQITVTRDGIYVDKYYSPNY